MFLNFILTVNSSTGVFTAVSIVKGWTLTVFPVLGQLVLWGKNSNLGLSWTLCVKVEICVMVTLFLIGHIRADSTYNELQWHHGGSTSSCFSSLLLTQL